MVTGGDFKRMVSGAYSELLLEYENINKMAGAGAFPGTHILRTMGAAIMPLVDARDESIGGLARRVSTAALFGARGNAGVVLSQLFRGFSKGLSGKYEATSSEFGKAFQYGILYAERVIHEGPEHPFITVAKAVAKGAYHAVRANQPITEILAAAIAAGEKAVDRLEGEDAGARIIFIFLKGCLNGLDGNFVSPAVSLSLGLTATNGNMPNPKNDLVRPYCVRFRVKNYMIGVAEMEQQLKDFGNFALVEQWENGIHVHIHTDHPGKLMEWAIGLGPLREIHITNMSETHALEIHDAIMPVGAIAMVDGKEQAVQMQEAGAHIIVTGTRERCPAVAELVGAAHSDFASSYVLVAPRRDYWMVFRQAKYMLGERVELVLCADDISQEKALRAFDGEKTALENAAVMAEAAGAGASGAPGVSS